MKIAVRDTLQTVQRVKVGVVGLVSVLVLIGMAATLSFFVSRERPNMAIGAPKADVATNLVVANSAAPGDAATAEPLAELGVAPAASPSPAKK